MNHNTGLKWIVLILVTQLITSAASAQHCVSFDEIPDLLKRGIYNDVEEITTEYYTATNTGKGWAADSLLYTKIESFNTRGYYTHVTEYYRDMVILNWTYRYDDDKLLSIDCDRNGYKRDIQQIRWIEPLYYVQYLFPYDSRLGSFHAKPTLSYGYRFNEQGQLLQTYEAGSDTSAKILLTTYAYRQDTILMTTSDYQKHLSFIHSTVILVQDDCGNPLQSIRDNDSKPILEFCRYRYYRDRPTH